MLAGRVSMEVTLTCSSTRLSGSSFATMLTLQPANHCVNNECAKLSRGPQCNTQESAQDTLIEDISPAGH